MLALFFSSILSGLVATAIMLIFLYLPLLWGGVYYDTLGAIGSLFSRNIDNRSRLIATLLLFAGGIFFAFIYGWIALWFVNGNFITPQYILMRNPVTINLFFPILGLAGGFGQGMFLALIGGTVITDFHPVEQYKALTPLMLSFFIGNAVYGLVVMFFQSQLLQLFA